MSLISPQLRGLLKSLEMPIERVLDLLIRTTNAYRDLTVPLPVNHPWKKLASENSERMRELVFNNGDFFKADAIETSLLGLLAYTQGLGRLAESTPSIKEQHPDAAKAGHGALAAAVFIDVIELSVEDAHPFWKAATFAIAHRPDADVPARETYPDADSRDAAFELLGILRDIVMYDGLVPERITAKLTDPKEKERLRDMNWSKERREADPTLGTEQGRIAPASQLERFKRHESLIRKEYASYETLMLETLSYVFKVKTPAIAELIVEAGGPSLVWHYLRRSLQNLEQTKEIKTALFRWNEPLATRIVDSHR
ncbi:MAG: hypothetical protein ABIP96_00785 [Patescibacteria group bacterium]